MTSKIINMADWNKDAEDRLLESMFAAETIRNDGFSERIVRRIRRRIWVRRLALPIAMLMGMGVAAKPAMQLVDVGAALLGMLPSGWTTLPVDLLPQFPLLLTGGSLLVIGMLTARLLTE